MIWIILIIGIVVFIIFRYLNESDKDKEDLQSKSLDEKFKHTVRVLNEYVFNGQGEIINFKKKGYFNLYKHPSNQLLQFSYFSGCLTIVWHYKYFQKETSHKKVFCNVRNLSLFEQQRIGEEMIEEMKIVILNFQASVLNGV